MSHIPKPMRLALHPGEQGNITLFFLLLVFVILGALSYSLYLGRSVQEKIKIDTAADASALSMANHTAAGLNMIALNNLAVAANLHTAAAIPFIGRYYAVARAFMVTVTDSVEVLRTIASPELADGSTFAKGLAMTKGFSGILTKAAAGNAHLNRLLVKTWFLATIPHGIEVARLNAPGSLPIPTKLLGLATGAESITKIKPLAQTTAGTAYCHAISASKVLGSRRNSVAFWVRGLLASVPAVGGAAGWLQPVEEFETVVQGIVAAIEGIVAPVRDAINATVGAIAGAACGIFPIDFGISIVSGILGAFTKKSDERKKVDGLCEALDKLNKAFDAITNPPIPRFDRCGIDHSGDFAAQSEAFADKMNIEDEVGFIYPRIDSSTTLETFKNSIDSSILVAKPLFLKEELPRSQNGLATVCPSEWTWESKNGSHHCEALLDGIDFGQSTANAKSLSGLLSRTQWAVGEARAEYHPFGDDPDYASTWALRLPDQIQEATQRTRSQLFWPAWRGQLSPSKSLGQVLNFIGKR